MVKSPLLRKSKQFFSKHDALSVFLLAAGIALAVFLPILILTGGYQLFFGDFQLQQIPFYGEVNRAIHNGEFFWNWNTDMGVNTVSSYSFYLLGSPFFLITLLFPHTWAAYLIAPLYCVKIGLAAMGAFLVIRKRVENKYFAMTGAMLYAFSGFQMFNLVFNHFHDVVAFFPFVILAFDAAMEDGKHGRLGIMVFLSALYSYFFLPGVAVFVLIYYIVRLISRDLKFSAKNLGFAAFEAVLGVLMAAVILLPTLTALADFPRANESFGNSYYMWFFSTTKRYFEIFRGMIMPPEIPGDLNFFQRGGDSWIPNWTSTSAWLPLFSLTGVWAYMRTKKPKRTDWLSWLLFICFVCSFVPLLNGVFLLFKSNYYTRWWYMAILFMSMATAIALDRADTNWKGGIKGTLIAGGLISLPVGLSGVVWILTNPTNIAKVEDLGDIFSGLEKYPDRFWLYVFFFALSVAVVILLTLIMRPINLRGSDDAGSQAAAELDDAADPDTTREGLDYPIDSCEQNTPHPSCAEGASHFPPQGKASFIVKWSTGKRFGVSVLVLTCLFAFLAWTFYEDIGFGKAFDPDFYNENYLYSYENIQLPDMATTRLENYDGVRNLSMFLHTPGVSSFHSVVPTSTVEFYDSLGIERDVASAIPVEHGALRSLLSIRWVLDDDKQRATFQDKSWLNYYGEIGTFDVWENTEFLPMGFCYDNVIGRSDFDSLSDTSRSNILLAAMVVDDDKLTQFSEYLNPAPFYTLSYTDLSQHANVQARASMASESWEFGKDSFTSTINMQRENYVFYSIPYDSGWTAYVDGVETPIERVNVGFMAVLVGEGRHTVEFRYVSPGFFAGLAVSAVAAAVFAVYLGVCAVVRRRREKY